MLNDMSARAQEIFRLVVDSYLETGEPVGSRTLSQRLTTSVSSATIRNDLMDLEDMGLLFAPHTSAGRLPTQSGLRFFVDALMQVENLQDAERRRIEDLKDRNGNPSLEDLFAKAGDVVSGLSSCATIIATPTRDRSVQQLQFINLGEGRSIAVIVFTDGSVDNRRITLPPEIPQTALISAANYLNAHLAGKTIPQARRQILDDIANNRSHLDALSAQVVQQGLAIEDRATGQLFVRGAARLLEDVKGEEDITAIQNLISLLDQQETTARLLEAAEQGQGVRIYIGSENRLFQNTNLSMVVSTARNRDQQVVGAVGVIGPTRINYRRVVPVVDYTSQVISRLIG